MHFVNLLCFKRFSPPKEGQPNPQPRLLWKVSKYIVSFTMQQAWTMRSLSRSLFGWHSSSTTKSLPLSNTYSQWKTCWPRKDVLGFFLCICRYTHKAKKSHEPFQKQNAHLLENAPQRGDHFFCSSCHKNNGGMYVMSLVAHYCPTKYIFSFRQRICERLCNSSVPMDCTIPIFILILFWSTTSGPDLTSQ